MTILLNGYASQGQGLSGAYTPQSYEPDEVAIVPDPLGRGVNVFRMECRQTDGLVESGYRSEIRLASMSVATERWYRWAVIPIRAAYRDAHPETIIFQVHATDDVGDIGSRAPCFAVTLRGDRLAFSCAYDAAASSSPGSTTQVQLGSVPVRWDTEMEFIMRIKWAYDSSGFVRVWLGDEQIVEYSGPCAFNDGTGPYEKFGAYPQGQVDVNSTPRIIYHRGLIIGNNTSSYSEVSGGKTAGGYRAPYRCSGVD